MDVTYIDGLPEELILTNPRTVRVPSRVTEYERRPAFKPKPYAAYRRCPNCGRKILVVGECGLCPLEQ